MDLISRKDAKEKGLKSFFTGKPCLRGHIDTRSVANHTCRSCILEKAARKYKINPEIEKNRVKKHRQDNREDYALRNRLRYQKNKREIREKVKKQRDANPEIVRAYNALRKARARGAEGKFTRKDLERLILNQAGACYYCCVPCVPGYHIDHKQPISRGGSNWPENLCVTCPACNLSKHAKTEEEFLASRRV